MCRKLLPRAAFAVGREQGCVGGGRPPSAAAQCRSSPSPCHPHPCACTPGPSPFREAGLPEGVSYPRQTEDMLGKYKPPTKRRDPSSTPTALCPTPLATDQDQCWLHGCLTCVVTQASHSEAPVLCLIVDVTLLKFRIILDKGPHVFILHRERP